MTKKNNTNSSLAPETLEQAIEVIAQQSEVIAALNKQITKLEAKAASGNTKPTVEIDGKTYQVNSGVRKGLETFKPADIANDLELATWIVNTKGQDILTLVEEEGGN